MRRWLIRLLAVVLLWGADLIVHRWLYAFDVAMPLVWALAASAAFLYAQESLARLTIPLGLVGELGSGLPPGVMFLSTLSIAHGLGLTLRRPRPSLPAGPRFLVVALLLMAMTIILDGLLARLNFLGPWPPARLAVLFATRQIVLPSLLAALAAVICSRLLQLPRTQVALAALFGAEAA